MQKDFVENCKKFSGFVRQVPQKGLKKKILSKMHGIKSQRRWNLFKPVIIIPFWNHVIHLT